MRLTIHFTATLSFSACMPQHGAPSAVSAASAAEPYDLAEELQDLTGQANPNHSSSTYFSLAVPFGPVNQVKAAAEARTGLTLKDRGEAHVTILTPPELAVLKSKLSGEEIVAALDNESLQTEMLDWVCLGMGKKAGGNHVKKAFFLVVRAPGLVERRERVAEAFQAQGGSPDAFDAAHFYPHVTVGFTQTDLHEQDGVIKNETSCVAPVRFAE